MVECVGLLLHFICINISIVCIINMMVKETESEEKAQKRAIVKLKCIVKIYREQSCMKARTNCKRHAMTITIHYDCNDCIQLVRANCVIQAMNDKQTDHELYRQHRKTWREICFVIFPCRELFVFFFFIATALKWLQFMCIAGLSHNYGHNINILDERGRFRRNPLTHTHMQSKEWW